MIDTIKLNLEDCEITDKAQIVIEPSPYIHDSQQRFINYDLFLDNSTGEIVQGKKAYLNTDKFNITIKPKYKLETDAIDKKFMYDKKYMAGMVVGKIQNIKVPSEKFNAGVFVQASLPRYLNETNYESISISDEKTVLKHLEKDLWNAGIKTNIWNANLSRFDIFSNIVTDESFSSYAEIFSMINLSRMQRFEYAGTTFLYKNGEQQICCYDKIFEIENKHKSVKEFKMPVHPPNVMRIENRLLKKRKIFDLAGFFRLKDMYKNYDFVKDHYRKEVGDSIFKYDIDELKIISMSRMKEEMEKFRGLLRDMNPELAEHQIFCFDWDVIKRKNNNEIENEMQTFKSVKGRNWLQKYLEAIALSYYLNMMTTKEFSEIIENLDFMNRFQKSRLKKKIEKTYLDTEMIKDSFASKEKRKIDLYMELKTKFYKAVA